MQQQNLKARYQVKGPRKEKVTYTKATLDKETKSLQQEQVTEERDCWMVYFPQGHSIRITDFAELKRMGYHLKPRLVDMNTGDVVDRGGDPYDFTSMNEDGDYTLVEDEDTNPRKQKSAA